MAEKQNDEGKQVQLFRVMMRKAVEDVVGFCTTDELLPIYQDVPDMSKSKIIKMIEVWKTKVIKKVEAHLEPLIVDADLDTLLKKRADIIKSQQDMEGTTAWRPTGSVCDDIRAHNVNALQTKRQKVEAVCKSKEDEVNALAAEVSKMRAEVAGYQDQLKHAYKSSRRLNGWLKEQQQDVMGMRESLSIQVTEKF